MQRLGISYILITTIATLGGQEIYVFPIRQEDCDTKCTVGLLNEIDSLAINTTVVLTRDLANTSTVTFELLRKSSTSFDYLFSIDTKNDCMGGKQIGSNYNCHRVSGTTYNITIETSALTDLSEATVRGSIKHHNLSTLAYSEQKLPIISEPKDGNFTLRINDQHLNQTDNCTISLKEDYLALNSECDGPVIPCLIEVMISDSKTAQLGFDRIAMKRLIHDDVQINISYSFCRRDKEVKSIRCIVLRGQPKHFKLALTLALGTGIPTCAILLSIIIYCMCHHYCCHQRRDKFKFPVIDKEAIDETLQEKQILINENYIIEGDNNANTLQDSKNDEKETMKSLLTHEINCDNEIIEDSSQLIPATQIQPSSLEETSNRNSVIKHSKNEEFHSINETKESENGYENKKRYDEGVNDVLNPHLNDGYATSTTETTYPVLNNTGSNVEGISVDLRTAVNDNDTICEAPLYEEYQDVGSATIHSEVEANICDEIDSTQPVNIEDEVDNSILVVLFLQQPILLSNFGREETKCVCVCSCTRNGNTYLK